MKKIHQIDQHGFFGSPSRNSPSLHLNETTPTIDYLLFRERFIDWVVSDNISFNGASSDKLKAVLETLNSKAKSVFPDSHSTVHNWMMKDFEILKERIREELHSAQSKINLSFDIWTAPNHLPFLGIEAHFIDRNSKFQNLLIAFRLILGSHTGENIALIINEIIDFFNIRAILGYSTADNASNNDTAAKVIYSHLGQNWRHMRLRCGAHILNLAARAGLYGKASKATTKKLEGEAEDRRVQQENEENEAIAKQINASPVNEKVILQQQQAWRAKGPIGKLHNIVIHVISSSQRREAFKLAQKIVKDDDAVRLYALILDGGVRWNSTYEMIKRGMYLFLIFTLILALY